MPLLILNNNIINNNIEFTKKIIHLASIFLLFILYLDFIYFFYRLNYLTPLFNIKLFENIIIILILLRVFKK